MRPIGESLLIAVLILALALALLVGFFGFGIGGSGRRAVAAAVLQQGSVDALGTERTFSIALPSNPSPRNRYPIIVMLHGGAGRGSLIAEQTGLANHVDRDQFIAVFPDAGGRQWNDGRSTTASNGDDVAFLTALVRHVANTYGGDPNRAFVAGASNGGNMVMRMACEASDTFKGYVAVVAGLPEELSTRCRPSRPVPILFILGKDDPAIPWAGGEPDRGRFGAVGKRMAAGGRLLSAPATVNFFAKANGCVWERVTDLPQRVNDGTSVRVHTFRCTGSPVVLYEIQGGGHGWPGSHFERFPGREKMFGVVSQQIDATEVMIDFFKKNGM